MAHAPLTPGDTSISLTVRIPKRAMIALDRYAKNAGISRSEAVRLALMTLAQEASKTDGR